MAVGAEHTEAVVEPLGDDGGGKRAEPAGGELERERQPVQPDADPGDVGCVPVVQDEVGRGGGRTVDEQPHGLEADEVVRSERLLQVRNREGRHPEDDLPGDAERLPTRRDHGQAGGGPQQPVDERGARPEDVLAVVHDEEERARSEEVDHRVGELLARQRTHVECRRDGGGNQTRVGQAGQLGDGRARRIRLLDLARQLEREARLPRATRSRERQQPGAGEEGSQLGELVRPADERARVRRKPRQPIVGRQCGQLPGQGLVELCELVAARLCPVVVAVLRQELAAVERESGPVGGGCAGRACIGRRPLQAVDVDLGVEREQFVSHLDRFRAENAAGNVDGLVEVVRGRRRVTVAPQRVHRLLAVEPVAGRHCEELHQLARLLEPEGSIGNRLAVYDGSESAQQPDRHLRHGLSMPQNHGETAGFPVSPSPCSRSRLAQDTLSDFPQCVSGSVPMPVRALGGRMIELRFRLDAALRESVQQLASVRAGSSIAETLPPSASVNFGGRVLARHPPAELGARTDTEFPVDPGEVASTVFATIPAPNQASLRYPVERVVRPAAFVAVTVDPCPI